MFGFLLLNCNVNDQELSQSTDEKIISEIPSLDTSFYDFIPSYHNRVPSPFSFEDKLEKVLLVSYRFPRTGEGWGDTTDQGLDRLILDDKIGYNHFLEEIILDSVQLDSLKRILFNFEGDEGYFAADCYKPRHCVYFLDPQQKVLGFIEICLECSNTSSSSDELSIRSKFQLDRLEDFMAWCGIKYNIYHQNFYNEVPAYGAILEN